MSCENCQFRMINCELACDGWKDLPLSEFEKERLKEIEENIKKERKEK